MRVYGWQGLIWREDQLPPRSVSTRMIAAERSKKAVRALMGRRLFNLEETHNETEIRLAQANSGKVLVQIYGTNLHDFRLWQPDRKWEELDLPRTMVPGTP